MFVPPSGPHSGHYVAQCAKGECGYLGELFRHWWGPVRYSSSCTPQYISRKYSEAMERSGPNTLFEVSMCACVQM